MPNPCRLPFRYRVEGFVLSRIELFHRELRDFFRTRFGWALLWFTAGAWALALSVLFLPR